jgi:hypothetical protein
MTAPSPPRIAARIRRHRCYELAARGQLADSRWLLVHGVLRIMDSEYGEFGHAWLECDGVAYDPVTDTLTPADDYRRDRQVKRVCVYTADEARELLLKHGIYGPWDE